MHVDVILQTYALPKKQRFIVTINRDQIKEIETIFIFILER